MKKYLFLLQIFLTATLGIEAQQSAKNIIVAFTGDIMMGTTYPSVQLPSQEGRQLFVDAASILNRADIAAGNLEGTLCDGGETHKKISKVCYAFRTPTSFASRLSEAGFDFLSMANNHAHDFGEVGIRSTMQCLDKLGIKYSGIKNYPDHAILQKDSVTYGFCAFGHNDYTLRHQDLESVRRIITHLVNVCDIVIVSFHGGAEGASKARLPYGKEVFCGEDRGSLRSFAHFCIDAGADVVFGHGPHVARAMEVYKEHLIAYSLGNFCTPYGISLSGISGYAPLLELQIDNEGRFQSGKIHSFIQHRGIGPRLDVNHSAAREIRRLTQLDFPKGVLQIHADGTLSKEPQH